jgi:hypothetical protein
VRIGSPPAPPPPTWKQGDTNSLACERAGGELIRMTEEKAWYSEPQTDENDTEKSAKLVIDHVVDHDSCCINSVGAVTL